MIKKKKEGKLAGPTQILPVNVRGPALILKTAVGLRVILVTKYRTSVYQFHQTFQVSVYK